MSLLNVLLLRSTVISASIVLPFLTLILILDLEGKSLPVKVDLNEKIGSQAKEYSNLQY